MAVTYATFIATFPEFTNETRYPEGQFDIWSAQAYVQLNACRFGTSLDLAAMLFTAHNLVLYARNAAAAATEFAGGGAVGQVTGPINSKSVDKASVSYSPDLQSDENAGFWNSTTYGQRLWQMMRQFTSGPVYVPGRPQYFGYGWPYAYRGGYRR
jgi:hypothetical protein